MSSEILIDFLFIFFRVLLNQQGHIMGVRINKAIGYGMTMDEFRNFSPLLLNKDKEKSFYDVFEPLEEIKELEKVSMDDFQENYALHDKQSLFWNPLEKDNKYTLYDMFHFIGYEDPYTDVLFMPSCSFIKRWYRYNDDIDYAEERWFGGVDRSDDVVRSEDIVKYVSYGHYPYSNNLMDVNGNKVKWEYYENFKGRELSILPEPPAELVYWTQKTGVLNKNGVLRLKPMMATWWR